MKQNFNLSNLTRRINKLLKNVMRFHYVISLSLIVIGATFTTYYINDILSNPPVPAEDLKTGFSDKFDRETIKKINKFKYRDETTIPLLPSGRTNPFTE